MGLLQPSNVSPSTKAGYGKMAIYSSQAPYWSWQINGDVPITGYKIYFYRNNAASTYVNETPYTSITPIPPKDGNGNANRVSIQIIGSNYGLVCDNNAVTEYKYKIRQYWGGGTTNYVDQIDFNVIYVVGNQPKVATITDATPNTYLSKTVQVSLANSGSNYDYSSYNRINWSYKAGNVGIFTDETIDTTTFEKTFNIRPKETSSTTLNVIVTVYNQFGQYIQSQKVITIPKPTANHLFTIKYDYENNILNTIKSLQMKMTPSTQLTSACPSAIVVDNRTGTGEDKCVFYSLAANSNYYTATFPCLINNTEYEFYLFWEVTSGGTTTLYVNETSPKKICYKRDGIALVEAEKINDNTYNYRTVYEFNANITFGTISNNNTPAMQENFTGYRLKQPSSRKGRSGTLTTLLSQVQYDSHGIPIYTDTISQMDKLFKASLSNYHYFLVDPKGNVYRVAISQPIQQTINTKTGKKEVTISVGWEEVGDSTNECVFKLGVH